MVPLVQEELHSKVSVLENKVIEHTRLLEKQQDRNDSQTELNTLLKLQMETSKEQQKTLDKFADTLERVNMNLTNLNNSQQQLGERVTEIEGFLSGQKFSMTDVLKYIGAIIGGIILAWVYIKLGIKQ
jgi:hypothetical protein